MISFFSNCPARTGLVLALGIQFITFCAAGAATEPTPSGATNASAPFLPKAVFAEDLSNGKDPFFPDSTRRKTSLSSTNSQVVQTTVVWSELKLKGIILGKGRRSAFINNAIVAEGEKVTIKLDSGNLVLQCLEIKERFVRVSIEGIKDAKTLELPKDM
jgi:hypothetical protein